MDFSLYKMAEKKVEDIIEKSLKGTQYPPFLIEVMEAQRGIRPQKHQNIDGTRQKLPTTILGHC
jgi:hypothetical protein